MFSRLQFRMTAGAVMFLCALAALGQGAPTQTFHVGIDTDNSTATGCTWTRADGSTVPGIDLLLTASVQADAAAPYVNAVSFAWCEGASFGQAHPLGGGWPVGLNVGTDGGDVVEFFLPTGVLGVTGAVRLYADASSLTGGTDLLPNAGLSGLLYQFSAPVPTLGQWGLLALMLLLAVVGIFLVRRGKRRKLLLGLCALLAVSATLLPFQSDGMIDDWSGIPPYGTDPTGDADCDSDLMALYVADDDNTLYFRLDVCDLENDPPVAADDAASTDEETPVNIDVLANDTDPDPGDVLTVTAVGTPAFGTAVIEVNQTITYTPSLNAKGVDTFTYTISDGHGHSDTATVTVTIAGTNDAPTAVDDAYSADEGALLTVNAASGVLANDTDPDTGAVLTAAVVTGPTHASAFSLAADGSFSYTHDGSETTTDSFTYTANDGTADSNVATVTLTINPVNDAPVFTAGADPTVLEDAGAQTVAGWATGISDGDTGTQVLTFNITGNTNAALFAAGPAVDPATGDLTFTPADDVSGSADITVTLSDDGGTASGGVDTSAPQTFTVTVTAVNDVPVFTPGPDQTVAEDAGPQKRLVAWATDISAGPADESGQVLTFNITDNTNPALFSAAPAIDATTGDLSYTTAADAVGTATLTVTLSDDGGTADGGVDTTAPITFTITVTGINDAPVFIGGPDQTVLEDAGEQNVPAWATGINDGDDNSQVLTFVVTDNTNPGLFAVAPTVGGGSGDLIYTPAADANGSATITLVLMDDGGTDNGGVDTSASQTFTINVTAVNDAPSFTAGPDLTILEDAGPQKRRVAWASGMSAGPADESGQVLTFNITGNTNAALFSAGPTLDATTGELSYTPAADAAGSATLTLNLSDDGGTADGGADTSADVMVTVTVTAVNDAPTFTSGGSVTYVGAATPQTEAGWATGISAGPADESGQVLTFNVTGNTNAALFDTLPAVDATSGDLTYTPANGVSGTAAITLVLTDDGGTADGGVDTSTAVMFNINLTAQNQEPSFTAGPDQTVNEDAGAQSVAGWATAIDDGDGATQMLTFNVTGNTNAALFAAGPAVDPATGTLTYTPAADANGAADITIELMDDGGTAGGGDDTSAPATFTITVNSVNDAPAFTAGADEVILEDAGAQTVVGWATGISAGAANESAQMLSFNITNNTNPGLFSAAPAVDPATGTLTYTAAANTSGNATLTLELMDDGGTANGGVDTSASQMFTISVTAVNDPPVPTADASYETYPHISLAVDRAGPAHGHLVSTFAGVLDNDTDPDSAGISVTTVVGSGDTTEPFTGATTLGGSVDLYADGSFIYHPPVNTVNMADTFQYTVEDTEGLSANATVTITLANAPPIWFINDTVAGGGNGTVSDPFNTLAAFSASAHAAGHIIFVHRGNTGTTPLDGGLNLLDSQVLIGEGSALQVVHPEDASTATVVAAGTRPVLENSGGDVVVFGQGNTVRGLELLAANGAGIRSGMVGMKTRVDRSDARRRSRDRAPRDPAAYAATARKRAGINLIDNMVIRGSAFYHAVVIGNETGTYTISNSDLRGMAGHSGAAVKVANSNLTLAIDTCLIGDNGIGLDMDGIDGSVTVTDTSINQTTAGFDNQAIAFNVLTSASFTMSGTGSIDVANAAADGIYFDAFGSEMTATFAGSVPINLDVSGGNVAFGFVDTAGMSFLDVQGDVNITGAGITGVQATDTTGTVNFDDLAISGTDTFGIQVEGGDATHTYTLPAAGLSVTSGNSVSITMMTGGSVNIDGGAVNDDAGGVVVSGNTFTAASGIASALDIDNTTGTGLLMSTNSGSGFTIADLNIAATDQDGVSISNSANVTLTTAAVTVTDGGGGGGTGVAIDNSTGLSALFTSVTVATDTGPAILLNTNTGTTTFNNLNLTSTGTAFSAVSAGTVNINNGGAGTANVTAVNGLGLNITGTTLGTTGGTSTFSMVDVSGTAGGINLANLVNALTISDLTVNVSGGTGIAATNCTLNVDPGAANGATVTTTGQLALALNTVTTTGFNLASTTVTGMGATGLTATACTGGFVFGDTAVNATTTGISLTNSAAATFTFDDLDVTTTAGTALTATTAGTVRIDTDNSDTPVLAATGGPVINSDNTALIGNIDSLTSATSPTTGLSLANLPATTNLTVSGQTTVSSPSGIGINIDDVEPGALLTFGNTAVNTRATHGIFVRDHDGAALNFADIDIPNPGAAIGNGIYVLTSGGMATSLGLITAASLDISDSNISINRLDADNNGVPDNETDDGHAVKLVDHMGGFTVTGIGVQGDGGTIQNMEGDGFSLIRSSGLSLTDIVINNIGTADQAAATVDNAAVFGVDIMGSHSITDSTLSRFQDGNMAGSNSRGVFVTNTNTDFTEFRVTDTTFFNDNLLLGDDAILFVTLGTVNGSVVVTSDNVVGHMDNRSEFYNLSGQAIQINKNGGGDLNVDISNSVFRDAIAVGGQGTVDCSSVGSGIMSADIDGCTFLALASGGVNNSGVVTLGAGGSTDYDGRVNNCTFGSLTQRTSDGRGAIRAATSDAVGNPVVDFDITITNNTIDDTDREAISILLRGDAVNTSTGNTSDIVIMGNDIGTNTPVANDGGVGREGIEVRSHKGDEATAPKIMNLTIINNTIVNFVDSTSDETIDIDSEDQSIINATVQGNNLSQAGAPGTADSFDFDIFDPGAAGCLDLNSANTNPNTFAQSWLIDGTNTCGIEDLTGGTSAANVQTFLSARNGGAGAPSIVGTFTVCNENP